MRSGKARLSTPATLSATSIPTSSSTSNGPIGMPKRLIEASMSRTE